MGVVEVDAHNATDGAGIVDSVYQVVKDFDNPEDWAMDGVALGLDALGFVANPFGSLFSAGVGWLMDHVSFLKEPLDTLAGDPGAVTGVAVTWREEVKAEVAKVAADYQRAAQQDTANWQGAAGDAYRNVASKLSEQAKALEPAAEAVAAGVQNSGMLVATVRGIIRDIIADVIGEIIAAALAALASSWFTLGGSLAAFTGWAVARATATAGKITGKISKLLNKLATILNKFEKLKGVVQQLAKLSKKFGDMAKSLGKTAARNGRAFRQMDGAIDNLNNLVRPKSWGDRVSGMDDAMNPRGTDGFADTINPGGLGRTAATEVSKEVANADENYEYEKKKAEAQS
jgi:uncharacterized protein YukE